MITMIIMVNYYLSSKNATEWHYANNYRGIKCGDMWECPDIFTVAHQDILIMSPDGLMIAAIHLTHVLQQLILIIKTVN
ncbi:MAG: hypothetical protein ACLRWM_11500 [Streptococcus sp.]